MGIETVPVTKTIDGPKPVITETIAVNEAKTSQNDQKTNESAATNPQSVQKKDEFSERFALLTKKEKRLLREKEEAKTLKETLGKQRSEIDRQEKIIAEFEKLKKSNPLKALELLGLNYNDLTQFALNIDNPTPDYQVKKVQEEIAELRRQADEEKKQKLEYEKAQAAQEEKDIEEAFNLECVSFAKQNADAYELINLFDQFSLVHDTIKTYYETHHKILSIKEGADLVEKHLEDQVRKSTATKKFGSLYKPTSEDNKAATLKDQPKAAAQSRTLTNHMASSTTPSLLPAKTENDRIQRALAALSKS